MEDIIPATSTVIPTVDLSPFTDGGDEASRKKVIDTISKACSTLGVFQVQNNGVALDQCEKLLSLCRTFFSYPDEVKQEAYCDLSGAGYGKMGDQYHDFEYLLMYAPYIPYNGVPTLLPEYRETFEEVYNYLVKTSQLLEEIINDCLGLPPNVLKMHNSDRCWDFMMPMHYTPSDETGNIGIIEHLDPGLMTIILQDDICGLEFLKDGEWIPLIPQKGTMVVIACDLIKVLSNKKIGNVTHRAFKQKDGKRLAIDFCYNYGPENWVQPLQELTTEIGVDPKYRGFTNKDYTDLIKHDYEFPPANIEDFTKISIYEI